MIETLPVAERVEILTRRIAALKKAYSMEMDERLQEIATAEMALYVARREAENGR